MLHGVVVADTLSSRLSLQDGHEGDSEDEALDWIPRDASSGRTGKQVGCHRDQRSL